MKKSLRKQYSKTKRKSKKLAFGGHKTGKLDKTEQIKLYIENEIIDPFINGGAVYGQLIENPVIAVIDRLLNYEKIRTFQFSVKQQISYGALLDLFLRNTNLHVSVLPLNNVDMWKTLFYEKIVEIYFNCNTLDEYKTHPYIEDMQNEMIQNIINYIDSEVVVSKTKALNRNYYVEYNGQITINYDMADNGFRYKLDWLKINLQHNPIIDMQHLINCGLFTRDGYRIYEINNFEKMMFVNSHMPVNMQLDADSVLLLKNML